MNIVFKSKMLHITKTLFVASVLAFSTAFAETPVEAIQNGTNDLFSVLKAEKATLKKNPGKVFEIVEKVVVPRFDFSLMSQWVMGRDWRQATPTQKSAFTKEFKELMINTYANSLLEYSDQEIKVINQPALTPDETEVVIKAQVISKNAQPVAINFMLHKVGQNWLAFDVSIEGVSVVTNYRASIKEEIRTKGIDGMIAEVAKKNTNARRGTK
jgi:phospholipid transport system substrate-binding protein